MSSAHIFYIPIMIFLGMIAGYFLGRRAAEEEARELRKRRERRQAIRGRQEALAQASEGPVDAEPADAAPVSGEDAGSDDAEIA